MSEGRTLASSQTRSEFPDKAPELMADQQQVRLPCSGPGLDGDIDYL